MINLIPSQEKKAMKRDFYSRFIATIFVVLGFSMFVATGTVFPSYFSSVIKKNLSNEKLNNQIQEPLPEIDQTAMNLIEEIKVQLSILESNNTEGPVISEKVIKEIISKKTSSIKIKKISYESNPIKGRVVSISGTAPSREELLIFRKALESNPSFKNINLPISNFIKGEDIEFNLTLTFS